MSHGFEMKKNTITCGAIQILRGGSPNWNGVVTQKCVFCFDLSRISAQTQVGGGIATFTRHLALGFT